MKVIIEGDLEQVASVVAPPIRQRPRKGFGYIAERNAQVAEEARILSRAFKLVRYSPSDKSLADKIRAALVGREDRTKSIMEKARQVLTERSE